MRFGERFQGHEFVPVWQMLLIQLEKKHMVKRPGNQNGLILEMFLGEPEFTPCWVKSRGGLVTINNKNSRPVFLEEGHYIQMGTETSYSLSQIEVNLVSFNHA